ncbi:hypothetical protein Godav_001103, partial [Gossypium davidsonii]|nr:hypothetical protein [Gossypium davidsonii]
CPSNQHLLRVLLHLLLRQILENRQVKLKAKQRRLLGKEKLSLQYQKFGLTLLRLLIVRVQVRLNVIIVKRNFVMMGKKWYEVIEIP